MAKDLIFEIGSEELPAGFIPTALSGLERYFEKTFKDKRLGFKELRTLGTPRRLAVIVSGLEERQGDIKVEQKGPSTKAAYDADGNPTKALEGFARSQGLSVSELKTVSTDKGDYLYAIKDLKGEATSKLLPEILKNAVASLNFKKAMRWGDHDISFARPLHWLLAVNGKSVVRFEYGHLKSGGVTFGHRFPTSGKHGKPGNATKSIKVDSPEAYIKALEAGSVIVDQNRRSEIISKGIKDAAAKAGALVLPDEGLLKEVVNLVEFPLVIMGSFDEEFLELPDEVIIGAMREHQRYFSVIGKDSVLRPHFITVANTPVKDTAIVREGNERVLRARLNDAKFYFDKDVSSPLSEKVSELKGVIFQAKLGTSYEKVERFTELALFIGGRVGFSEAMGEDDSLDIFLEGYLDKVAKLDKESPEYNKYVLGRGAMLAKADLVSGVVGEFPKLQGVMGAEYARREGEELAVSEAIVEHYMPIAAAGELPTSDAGSIISIADKLDTIAGCFSVGLVPTGAADPYALRRSALGIISIIISKDYELTLKSLVDKALGLLGNKPTRSIPEVEADIMEFFKERLRRQLLSKGLSFDAIDAVLSTEWANISDSVKRIEAIEKFKGHEACEHLTMAFKRVSNILRSVDANLLVACEMDVKLFEEESEKRLHKIILDIAPEVESYREAGDYENAFTALASIKDAIDEFFDKVMVMADDEAIKKNRLMLLKTVSEIYSSMADLSKLSS